MMTLDLTYPMPKRAVHVDIVDADVTLVTYDSTPTPEPKRPAGLFAVHGNLLQGYQWTCNLCQASPSKRWGNHESADAVARNHWTISHDENFLAFVAAYEAKSGVSA